MLRREAEEQMPNHDTFFRARGRTLAPGDSLRRRDEARSSIHAPSSTGTGDWDGAFEMAHKAERVARASGADLQIAIAVSWMAQLRLMRGELAEAAVLERERAANAIGEASRSLAAPGIGAKPLMKQTFLALFARRC